MSRVVRQKQRSAALALPWASVLAARWEPAARIGLGAAVGAGQVDAQEDDQQDQQDCNCRWR
jgi:hypothetical protein